MARNGPTGQAAARTPPRRQPAEHDPFYVPQTAPPQWPPQAPGYAEQSQQPYPAHPFGHPHPHPQQGQQHPQQGFGHAPAFGSPQGQQGYPQQPQYAEQAPNGYGQPPGYAAQQSQGYYYPQHAEADPAHGFGAQAPGQPMSFASAAAPAANWNQLQGEQRGFDLGNYPPQGDPGLQAPPDQFGPAQQGYGETDAEYDEAMADDEEEPRRGRRMMLIAAALVGAIGLGGAMAYTYKSFVASSGGRAPLIKAADFGPNKVKPVTPGGKEIANTDKKLLNRLDDPNAQSDPQEERTAEDPNAPRRVRIIPITPGGPSPTAAAATPSSNTPMVPGIMLDNIGPPRQQQPPMVRAQPPVQPVPPPAARASPAPPVRVVTPAPPQPQAEAPPPVAKKVIAAPPKNPVPKVKEAAAPAPVITSTSGTSGYVAVLASQKSRMDALKAFADLQQKYGDVLSSKTPDVQEANLGDKGMWYRAVVGPPGSRDGASNLCSQLKTAGFAGCWVTPY